MNRRQIAWILILIVDVAYVAWGAMAAAMPDGLAGPGGKAILPAGYEGYSGSSWSELLRTSPMTAKYMIVLFRTYGVVWRVCPQRTPKRPSQGRRQGSCRGSKARP